MDNDKRGQFSLKLIQKCPVCNHDYTEGKIEILDEAEQGFLAYLTCGFCSSSIIVRVMTMPHGLIGNAILTDLTSAEVMDFALEPEVGSDNVLDLHRLISQDSSFIEKLRNN
ncbi:MAG TPA: hypothetical protein VJK25_01025 [Patescibacteria group bacterium]|nr:hypothetical protein [Patescibacteria group bacterium]